MLDFEDKSERNWCFSFGNLWIIFSGASSQLFPPREKWKFGWVRGHPPANGGRDYSMQIATIGKQEEVPHRFFIRVSSVKVKLQLKM